MTGTELAAWMNNVEAMLTKQVTALTATDHLDGADELERVTVMHHLSDAARQLDAMIGIVALMKIRRE